MEEEDRISKLPMDVLCVIISKLITMKEAVRTSALSRKWRYLWKLYPHIKFDELNLLGSCSDSSLGLFDSFLIEPRSPWEGFVETYSIHGLESSSFEIDPVYIYRRADVPLHKDKFVSMVDKFLELRGLCAAQDFRVTFILGNEDSASINNWIKYAIESGVENLDLNFENPFYTRIPDALPHVLFYSEKKNSLKELHLNTCVLVQSPNSVEGFPHLKTLCLQLVSISSDELAALLEHCPLLGWLELFECFGLFHLKITSSSLETLRILDPFFIEKVSINALSLTRFDFTGKFVEFDFINVPRLLDGYFKFSSEGNISGVTSQFAQLSCHLPHLEWLTLVFEKNLKREFLHASSLQSFNKLKELSLTIEITRFMELLWITSLLEATPFLEKLYLNIINYEDDVWEHESDVERPSKYFCKHLKEMTIFGFRSSKNEAEFIQLVIDNCPALEAIIIDFSFRKYHRVSREEIVESEPVHVAPEVICDKYFEQLCRDIPDGAQLILHPHRRVQS